MIAGYEAAPIDGVDGPKTREQGDCGSRRFSATGFAMIDVSGGGKTLRFAMP